MKNRKQQVAKPYIITATLPSGGTITYPSTLKNGIHNPVYTPPKAMLKPHKSMRRNRRRTPKKEQAYPLVIVEKGWQDKKWIRLDDLTSRGDRRVWRNAKFLSEELFLTRYNHRHGSCLYHICNHFGKWVFYCRVPKGFTECGECEKPIDEAVLMIQNLQKLKR